MDGLRKIELYIDVSTNQTLTLEFSVLWLKVLHNISTLLRVLSENYCLRIRDCNKLIVVDRSQLLSLLNRNDLLKEGFTFGIIQISSV